MGNILIALMAGTIAYVLLFAQGEPPITSIGWWVMAAMALLSLVATCAIIVNIIKGRN